MPRFSRGFEAGKMARIAGINIPMNKHVSSG
jgi:hypothetical protein